LSHERELLNGIAARQIDQINRAIVKSASEQKLKGVLMTGSVARKEAAIVAGRNGAVHWLSDVEYVAIGPAQPPETSAAIKEKLAAATAGPAMSVGIKVDIGVTSLNSLARLRDSIFARELRANGKLLWGDPQEIRLPTSIDNRALRRDALRLLNNRIIEQLEARVRYERGESSANETRFAIQKLWLDLGTSLSVFLDCYQPSYTGRMKALEARRATLIHELGALAVVLSARLREATAARLSVAPSDLSAEVDFRTLWRALADVWRWEGRALTGKVVSLDDWKDIPRCLRRAHSLNHCVRDYYRAARRTGLVRRLSPYSTRPILASGCPGNAIYAAGCLLLFFWEAIEAGTPTGHRAHCFANLLLHGTTASCDIRDTAVRLCDAWKLHLRAA
jgi:hypothetical protein